MSTMRPRPPQSQGLRAANHARDKDVEQVRRLLSAQKPAPKATPVAGGGILGIAEVDSLSSSIKHDTGGLAEYLITYEAPWDFGVAGLLAAGSFCTVSGSELHLTAGEYEIACRVSYGWASGVAAPSAVQVALVNAGDASDAFYNGYDQMFPTFTQADGKSGICAIVGPFGRTIVAEGGSWFKVEASVSGQPVADGTPVSGIAGDPGLHWSIKKYR